MKIKGAKEKQERKEEWKDNKRKDDKKKMKKNRVKGVLSTDDEICECEILLRVYRSEISLCTYELLAFSSEVRSSSLVMFRGCTGCFLGNVTSLPLP